MEPSSFAATTTPPQKKRKKKEPNPNRGFGGRSPCSVLLLSGSSAPVRRVLSADLPPHLTRKPDKRSEERQMNPTLWELIEKRKEKKKRKRHPHQAGAPGGFREGWVLGNWFRIKGRPADLYMCI